MAAGHFPVKAGCTRGSSDDIIVVKSGPRRFRRGECIVSTRILLLVCAVAAFSSPSLAASSSDFDGKYSGPIMCDALPVAAPLHTTFFLEITNGLAAYHKDV